MPTALLLFTAFRSDDRENLETFCAIELRGLFGEEDKLIKQNLLILHQSSANFAPTATLYLGSSPAEALYERVSMGKMRQRAVLLRWVNGTPRTMLRSGRDMTLDPGDLDIVNMNHFLSGMGMVARIRTEDLVLMVVKECEVVLLNIITPRSALTHRIEQIGFYSLASFLDVVDSSLGPFDEGLFILLSDDEPDFG